MLRIAFHSSSFPIPSPLSPSSPPSPPHAIFHVVVAAVSWTVRSGCSGIGGTGWLVVRVVGSVDDEAQIARVLLVFRHNDINSRRGNKNKLKTFSQLLSSLSSSSSSSSVVVVVVVVVPVTLQDARERQHQQKYYCIIRCTALFLCPLAPVKPRTARNERERKIAPCE